MRDHSQIVRGMPLIESAGEVMPEESRDQVAEIYEQIRTELRVPVVNFIFRVLATEPERLSCCWSAVRPMVRTIVFEREADALRTLAAFADDDRQESIAKTADPRLQAFTKTIHYVLPKLLLIASAINQGLAPGREASSGPLHYAEIPLGIAPGAIKMPLLAPEQTRGKVRETLMAIKERHQHPGVASYYRAVAAELDFLHACWSQLTTRIDDPAYAEARQRLAKRAEEALPRLRLDTVFLEGMDSEAASEVRAMMAVFRLRLIPDLLLDVSLIRSWLEGSVTAARSPFPL